MLIHILRWGWGHDNPQDPILYKNGTGFVVTFSNFPLLWVSTLLTDISLYTLHSEYVEFSRYVRNLFPLKSLIKVVIDNLGMDIENLNFILSSAVYEENNDSIVVATSPSITPNSNHIAIKCHWFRQNSGK